MDAFQAIDSFIPDDLRNTFEGAKLVKFVKYQADFTILPNFKK